MLDRRKFVLGSALLGSATLAFPKVTFAKAATHKRLLFILQRGAADGLATLAPIGDPDFLRLRGGLAEDYADVARIDGLFALHPALQTVGDLFAGKQALFVHAAATAYRNRSHFEGQNLLESGGAQAYALRDGWLNRLLALLPQEDMHALALAPAIPLAMQGPQTVSSYAPSSLPGADADLLRRLERIYESDPQLSALLGEAQQTRMMAGDTEMRNLRDANAVGTLAASLMQGDDGARVMMIESNGWDSHANQATQFRNQARQLDALIGSLREGLAGDWADTLVLIATEFGRTAALNGTNGTDHGTASAMMVLGGGVRGGRVESDWPGLRQRDLYEERDLRPTQSTEAVMAGAVAEHFNLNPELTMQSLFPGRSLKAITGLIRL